MPVERASASSSSLACTASSRVGTRISAEGRVASASMRWTIGTAKAIVLPEPVEGLGEHVGAAQGGRHDERLDRERVIDAAGFELACDLRAHAERGEGL